MDIAKRMRARRKEQKLSQVQLSRRSDVSLGTLKRFEQEIYHCRHLLKLVLHWAVKMILMLCLQKKAIRPFRRLLMNNYKSLQVWMNDKKVGTLAMAAGYLGNCK